jgi:hypothetical protein
VIVEPEDGQRTVDLAVGLEALEAGAGVVEGVGAGVE